MCSNPSRAYLSITYFIALIPLVVAFGSETSNHDFIFQARAVELWVTLGSNS
jgi:hypothetical protein